MDGQSPCIVGRGIKSTAIYCIPLSLWEDFLTTTYLRSINISIKLLHDTPGLMDDGSVACLSESSADGSAVTLP